MGYVFIQCNRKKEVIPLCYALFTPIGKTKGKEGVRLTFREASDRINGGVSCRP
jgi:hypothetical protein